MKQPPIQCAHNIKATVKARYTAMTLRGLALAITFPQPNVTLTKTGSWPRKGLLASVQTTASTVVWPQFDLAPGNKRTFKAGFRVSRSTPPTTVLAFEVTVLQTAGATAGADTPYYCARSTPYPVKAKVVGTSKALV